MNSTNGDRLSKNERRLQAREQARQAREAEKKRNKRNKLLVQGGVAAAIIAVVVIVGLVFANSLRPAAAATSPKNMASGGVVFSAEHKVVETPVVKSDEKFVPTKRSADDNKVHVQLFVDFMCPACGAFEQTYGPMLEQMNNDGQVDLEVYPLNILDTYSAGTRYSSRAASAFACSVQYAPDQAFAYQQKLWEKQPAEGTTGLTDQELAKLGEEVGIKSADFKKCVTSRAFIPFVEKAAKQVLQDGVLGLAEGAQLVQDQQTMQLQDKDQPQRILATPTVIVDGEQWVGQRDGELEQFLLKKLQGGTEAAS